MSTYTVSLWVRSNVEEQELWRGFFNTYNNPGYGFQLDCNGSNQFRFHSDLGVVLFAPLTTEWSHIAVVADSSTTSFYFNGDINVKGDLYIISTKLYNTNNGKIECEYIVLASGMWSRQLAAETKVSVPL